MGKDRSRISIPNRAVEYSSVGAGGVREYKLSPEELEEIRQKYPATKRDKAFKKPVAHNPREDQKPREGKDMTGQRISKEGPSSGLTKQIFLEQIASGETVASVEKAWGMKYNTLPSWVKKWDLKGINPAKAQELLASGTPKETQLPRDKEAQQEIEELKAEVERWKAQATEAVALAGKAAEESASKIERMKENLRKATDARITAEDELNLLRAACAGAVAAREAAELDLGQTETRCRQYTETIDQFATECDRLQEELNRLTMERDHLQADNDRLNNMIILQAQQADPEPATDVHLLDRSIADLTRAKWILDRLSAAGE